VYVIAWWFGLIIASLLTFLAILILYPPSRNFCFGPHSHYIDTTTNPTIRADTLVVLDEPAYPWGPSKSERQASIWAASVENTVSGLVPGKGGIAQMKKNKDKADAHLRETIKDAEEEYDTDEKGTREMFIQAYGRPGLQIFGGIVDKWERIAKSA
jgi:hypothetical protein